MAITGGFGGGAGGGSVEVIGNGIVIHNEGQLSAKPIVAVGPASVENPEGIGGPIVIRAEAPNFPLGKLESADMGTVGDKVIAIRNTTLYRARLLVLCGATVAPDPAMIGGFYTLPGKNGAQLVAPRSYEALTTRGKVIEIPLAYPDTMAMPYIYWSLDAANPGGGTVDIYLYGDVLKPLED